MKDFKFLFLALFGLLATATFTEAQVKFNKVGIGVSYWNRSYSGPDERVILPSYSQEEGFTSGSFMPTLHAELALVAGLALEGKAGIWNRKYNGTEATVGVTRTEEISQRIIPVALLVNYYTPGFLNEKLKAFAGVGVSRYFIQNDVERTVTGQPGSLPNTTFNGNDYGMLLKVGAETALSENLSLALEGILNTGKYIQNHTAEVGGPSTKHEISLKGMSIGMVVKYNFSDWTSDEE